MRIVVTTTKLHPAGLDVLRAGGAELRFMDQGESAEALAALFAAFDPHGVISRTIPIGDATMAAAPSLRAIAKTGVGFDNVDVAAATRRGIPVMFSFGANARSVAEHALALMFALARNVARHDALIRAGHWSRFDFPAHELGGKRLGIVGYGQSGQHLTRLARGLDMEVTVFAPRFRYERPPEGAAIAPALADLLAAVDIVSLHCPLTPETHHMIDAAALALMRPGAWVVNTARGPVVDQAALVAALRSGHIGGAALDTYEVEPIDAANPLLGLPNTVLTPHAAGTTLQSAARTHPTAARNLLNALAGKLPDPRALANPEVAAAAFGAKSRAV